MGVRRSELPFEGHYTQVPNSWMRDERLSRRARGLLAEIMTHKVGWHITIGSLQKAGSEGRDAIRGALIELKDAGYLRLLQSRGERGRWNEVEYELMDPGTGDGFSDSGGFTGVGFTAVGSADVGKSDTKKNISIEDQLEEDQKPRKRGSRISRSFAVSEEMRSWAAVHAPAVNLDRETDSFIDYWDARADKGAVKLDWVSTWRNSMRRAQSFAERDGWKPAQSVERRNVTEELLSEQKARWCAAHGVTVEEYDRREAANDTQWLASLVGSSVS